MCKYINIILSLQGFLELLKPINYGNFTALCVETQTL
jgi:hypothetical protein